MTIDCECKHEFVRCGRAVAKVGRQVRVINGHNQLANAIERPLVRQLRSCAIAPQLVDWGGPEITCGAPPKVLKVCQALQGGRRSAASGRKSAP